MTEDEAKTKTCCGPQLVTLALIISKPDVEFVENPGRCIASACMAWRWSRDDYEAPKKVWHTAYSATDGYCGLAGAPT